MKMPVKQNAAGTPQEISYYTRDEQAAPPFYIQLLYLNTFF
jgi:hypothetical protein